MHLHLTIGGAAGLSPTATTPFSSPTTGCGGHFVTSACHGLSSRGQLSSGCEVVPHSGFDLHSPADHSGERPLLCPLAVCVSSLVRCLRTSFVHFEAGLSLCSSLTGVLYLS